ncbi:MAG: TonB-dependent receptor [Pseudomonadota bacterium]
MKIIKFTCLALPVALSATIEPAFAQSANADGTVDEVVVTGTRIRTPNLESPNPITSLSSQDMAYTGKTSIQELVNEVGALVGSEGESEVNNGENFLNLRNLGTNRTLVLVDGQRFVSGSSGSSAVDVNAIPLAMIERVDVFTGGASAIYGADAVTGVVNFILKDDFEGLAFDAQYGDAEDGDFEDQQYSLTAGRNFHNGRGNITASLTYGKRPIVAATARADSSTNVHERINNLDGPVPEFVLRPGTQEAFFTEGGARIDPFEIFSEGFNGDGTPFEHGVNVGSFGGTGEIGGDGIPNWLLFAQAIRPENERTILTLKSHYDVSDAFRPYTSVMYSDVTNAQFEQHSLTVGTSVARDNAFLPASVLAAAGPPGGPPIFYNRWDLDGGLLDYETEKETYRIILGAEGDLSSWLRYDVAFNRGETDRRETLHNNRLYDRYLAAVDSVDDGSGNIVCRSNLDPASFNSLPIDFISTSFDPTLGPATFTAGPNSGCLPFNPFTTDNSVNDAARDWIWQPTTSDLENTQTIVTAYLAGESSPFFEVPGGPVSFVLGGEYREEESSVAFDEISGSDRTVAWVAGTDLSGKFDVTEAFVELSAPLFGDVGPWLRGLTVDAAYRFSDYSTIGSTGTWKAGVIWDTAGGFSFRGTVSSAVRAPNVGELFEPRTNISISLGQDPCDIDNVNLGSPTRAANCATALNAIGVDPVTFDPLLGTFFPAIEGGNPELKEETADTQTIGFVWQPTFVEGLTISADYFNIDIEDAVIRPNQIAIFNACYDSATLDNIFCTLLSRDATTGAANFVELQSVNVAEIQTTGYEFSAVYQLPTAGLGDLRFSLNGTYLDELKIQKSPLPILTDDKDLFNTDTGGSSPEWVVNFDLGWQYGNWDANYGFNYNSKTLRPPLINAQRDNAANIIDDPFVDPFVNHDLQFGYTFDESIRVYAGIRNLSDEAPDKVQGSLNGPSGRQGFAGRTFYAGVNVSLADIWK